MTGWLRRLLGLEDKPISAGTFIIPNGRANDTDPCFHCGRLRHAYEEPFMIYGKPICEDCFWDDDHWHERLEKDGISLESVDK